MSETSADIGFSSTFGIQGETAGVFEVVAEVVSIKPPPLTRDALDATTLSSPDGYKEFIPGMKEAGEATIGLNFVPSATAALDVAFEEGRGRYQITFPNGVTLTFSGVITNYDISELTTDKMQATFTVKASGKPVLAGPS